MGRSPPMRATQVVFSGQAVMLGALPSDPGRAASQLCRLGPAPSLLRASELVCTVPVMCARLWVFRGLDEKACEAARDGAWPLLREKEESVHAVTGKSG